MFYRRKIILSILEIFGGKLEKIRLQKLLFLFSQNQEKPTYDFIPYKYGCYSYSASADLNTMVNKNLLLDLDNCVQKVDNVHYSKTITEQDRKVLFGIKRLYESLSSDALIKHTYINYPYFAINSTIADKILSQTELQKVNQARPKKDETVLFTIGYEGISLEEYINKLIRNNVQVLVDVRRNPLSMKYGFSKNLLKKFCENIGIEYLHFPEVGIESDQRQELNNQKDYDLLFNNYKKNNLTKTINTQSHILKILATKRRIALTCFEANICQCHRKPLAESIAAMPEFKFVVKHI